MASSPPPASKCFIASIFADDGSRTFRDNSRVWLQGIVASTAEEETQNPATQWRPSLLLDDGSGAVWVKIDKRILPLEVVMAPGMYILVMGMLNNGEVIAQKVSDLSGDVNREPLWWLEVATMSAGANNNNK